MKVVIVEDEKPAARRLQRMLAAHDISVEVMLHSVEESVNWFHHNEHPDLLFLDIQLADGLSFEIFEEVTIKSPIIFTTAYDEYALQAFKLNSVDYLLKPIDQDELDAAIEKYKSWGKSIGEPAFDLEALQALIAPKRKPFKRRFTTKIGQRIKMIPVETIECFYSENKSTHIFTIDGRSYLIDETLEQLEDKLDPELFFRVSRKYYVHINAIKDIISYTNSRLKIILNHYNESEIIVSRERVKEFKYWLE